jgi:hypothetical protein
MQLASKFTSCIAKNKKYAKPKKAIVFIYSDDFLIGYEDVDELCKSIQLKSEDV